MEAPHPVAQRVPDRIGEPRKANGAPQRPVRVKVSPGQAVKDEPQPQVLVALGFLITNWAPSRPSW